MFVCAWECGKLLPKRRWLKFEIDRTSGKNDLIKKKTDVLTSSRCNKKQDFYYSYKRKLAHASDYNYYEMLRINEYSICTRHRN